MDRVTSQEEPIPRGRLAVVAGFVFLTFALFVARLFQLQVVEGESLRQQSERNSVRTVRLAAPRGDMLDREGRLIASTRPAFHVEVMPSELQRPDAAFRTLGSLLGRDAAELRARYGTPRGRARFAPVELATDLEFDALARVEAHRYALPGVLTEARPYREYPDGRVLGHLLGSIGEIRADQLERPEYDSYRQGEVIGQSGLELDLERWLRGTAGGRNVVVNVAGREVDRLDEVDPVAGNTAILTLDLDLQRVAAAAFEIPWVPPKGDDADASPPPPGVPGVSEKLGSLVALDPRTGEVLAMLSRPTYDPNVFAGGIDPAIWKQLLHDPWKPLLNRAISSTYPPGSTYKSVLALAALEEGLIQPKTRVFCPGSFAYGNRVYRCWKKEGHGSVDVHSALVRSCDVFFYQVGLKLGIDRIARYANSLGLGQLTRIDLNDEKSGLIPTSAWKKRRFKEAWMGGDTVSASIGQGYDTVTPLQLAVAYGAIATGEAMRPHLLLRVEKPDGTILERSEPEVLSVVPVSPENLEIVRQGLQGVVHEGGGTGARARVAGVSVAGKTGTSQVIRLDAFKDVPEERIPLKYRDHAWFASWAPVEDPEIVVAVIAEHGGHGGSAAAPIAQRVLAKYFEKKRGGMPPAVTVEIPIAPASPTPEATSASGSAPNANAAPTPAAQSGPSAEPPVDEGVPAEPEIIDGNATAPEVAPEAGDGSPFGAAPSPEAESPAEDVAPSGEIDGDR